MSALLKKLPESTLAADAAELAERIAALDWQTASADLYARGSAVLQNTLTAEACKSLASMYSNRDAFRSRIRSGHRHTLGIIFHNAE